VRHSSDWAILAFGVVAVVALVVMAVHRRRHRPNAAPLPPSSGLPSVPLDLRPVLELARDDPDAAIAEARRLFADPDLPTSTRGAAGLLMTAMSWQAGRYDEAMAGADVLTSTIELREDFAHTLAHARVDCLVELGRYDQADDLAAKVLEAGRCRNEGVALRAKRAEITYWRGDLDGAADRFAQLGPPAPPLVEVHLALIDWDLGRRPEAARRARAAVEAGADGSRRIACLVLASMEAELGRPASAREALAWSAEGEADAEPVTAQTAVTEPAAAETAAAETAITEPTPPTSAADTFSSWYRGLAEGRIERAEGDPDRAIATFDRTRAALLERGLRPYAAEALAERGRTRRLAGDEDGGTADLLAAADEWRAMGCRPRADRITAEATSPAPPPP